MLLAGEDHPCPALAAGGVDEGAEQLAGDAPALPGGQHVQPEHCLVAPGGIVEGGVLVHLILDHRAVGDKAVDKAPDLPFFFSHPEMAGKGGGPGGDGGGAGSLGGGKTGGLHGGSLGNVLGTDGADLHGKNPPF